MVTFLTSLTVLILSISALLMPLNSLHPGLSVSVFMIQVSRFVNVFAGLNKHDPALHPR